MSSSCMEGTNDALLDLEELEEEEELVLLRKKYTELARKARNEAQAAKSAGG